MKLSSPTTSIPNVGAAYARRLEKLEIYNVRDLLTHVPFRYLDFRNTKSISSLNPDELVTVGGEITEIKNIYTKWGKKIQLAKVRDKTGTIEVVWFNQSYLVKSLPEGTSIFLAGKVGWFSRKLAMISPEYEIAKAGPGVHTGRLIPVYHETAGISSKWLRSKIALVYPLVEDEFAEFLPQKLLTSYAFVLFKEAVKSVHFPKNLDEAEKGRVRLSFNELLFLQLASYLRKEEWLKNEVSYQIAVDQKEIDSFINSLPFTLTSSQDSAVREILEDLKGASPMNRILEGDVGSGKTVVSAIAAFASFSNGFQSVFMAPTQILAQQHFETLNSLFSPFKIRVTLVTSEGIKKGVGKTDIFVGTHALIHRKVDLDKAALVVIDEQHRFGVEQRSHLIRKVGKRKISPHVLTMTATPIPRTVALTFYGDLALSTLRELPAGRKKITTWVLTPAKREAAYSWIEKKILKDKVQAFVICPLIEESQVESMTQVKAATKEFENLKKLMPKVKLGLIHGKMSLTDKSWAIEDFSGGGTDVLVATPVVEVGIDIPNACVMVIEGAERFGLAQLHQLRGRVGRSDKKSYCLVFSQSSSRGILTRLTALTKSISGFELAELDLKLRGPGEVFGVRQHGFLSLKIASWQDTELIKKAKEVALSITKNPKSFPKLAKMLKGKAISPN
ncbi:hypothetical protein A2129_01685 [Candidatus Woesebacteria bacterium GWC1_42_13]|uniref:Probable DNA 3'-5' helicase RecG n=2 Tax=Candidatus Woeseibacteriota TaxID=1752722 RepID=A0A1F7WUW9_9BACT|nr:MAG: hypothetical protein A2112_02275 [Candidatus Woesebacteria bacterium GWA1_42_12]OGM06543.1 MAG: hypothetical protein A2129_01685 [Candidatus Woesebacteria bacterium GWC1_42_13]